MKSTILALIKLVLVVLLSSAGAQPLQDDTVDKPTEDKYLTTVVRLVEAYQVVTVTGTPDPEATSQAVTTRQELSRQEGNPPISTRSSFQVETKHSPKHKHKKHPHKHKHRKHPHKHKHRKHPHKHKHKKHPRKHPHKHKHKKHPHKHPHKKGRHHKYPFERVVAFGDNLSDNGNGSYAHGVADLHHPHNSIYGFRTWTNGPVAVSYLVHMLGKPLSKDYAFGHAQGGSRIGATIRNSYTHSEYAPDAFTQVHNYTHTSGFSRKEVENTLHFLWIGNNDINLLHLSAARRDNSAFAEQMAEQMTELVGNLVHFGAKHIFVPGLYAKHLSPSWHFYAKNLKERALLGHAIHQANMAIRARLHKHYGSKVTFYDVFGFMEHLWNNHGRYGLTHVGTNERPAFCDGQSQENWSTCVIHHHGRKFYWMQFLDMTTRVHQLIAEDMHRVLRKRFLG